CVPSSSECRHDTVCGCGTVVVPFHQFSDSWTFFFFSSRRRHTRCYRDWSSDVCSSDLPCCAMAIASDASVTVSIAAEQSGICKRMPRVNCVDVSVSVGSTSERAGSNNTSSKVSPSEIISVIMARYITPLIFVPQDKQTPAICRGPLKKLPKRRYYFHKRRSPAHGRDGQHRERQKTYTRN